MKCNYALDGKQCRENGLPSTGLCVIHTALMKTAERKAREAKEAAFAEAKAGEEIAVAEPSANETLADARQEWEQREQLEPVIADPALETDAEGYFEDELSEPEPTPPDRSEEILSRFRKEVPPKPTHRRVAPTPRAQRRDPEEASHDGDPETRAARLVAKYQQQEREARLARGTQARDKDGLVRPDAVDRERDPSRATYRVIPRIPVEDETAIVDPVTGKRPACIPAGWLTRWVATRDHYDRPTRARVAKRERCGWIVITDTNGDPIEGIYGLAMMGSAEAQAAFTLLGTPAGTQWRDEALELAGSMAADIREMAGEDAANIVIGDEHRKEREMAGRDREAEIIRGR